MEPYVIPANIDSCVEKQQVIAKKINICLFKKYYGFLIIKSFVILLIIIFAVIGRLVLFTLVLVMYTKNSFDEYVNMTRCDGPGHDPGKNCTEEPSAFLKSFIPYCAALMIIATIHLAVLCIVLWLQYVDFFFTMSQ